MKRREKVGYTLRKYWKDTKGFDSNEEFQIYQYLCGNLKEKAAKKIDEKKKFKKYKTWREHVEELLKDWDNDTLSEFYHFIKLERRYCDIDMGMHTSFAMPFVITITAGALIPWLLNSDFLEGIEIQQMGIIEQFFMFILFLVIIYIFAIVLAFTIVSILSPYVKSKNEMVFWEDYLEIVESKMESRKLKK